MLKVQKRLRLGPSTMGLRINYELPLVNAQNVWAPPARLMIRWTLESVPTGLAALSELAPINNPPFSLGLL